LSERAPSWLRDSPRPGNRSRPRRKRFAGSSQLLLLGAARPVHGRTSPAPDVLLPCGSAILVSFSGISAETLHDGATNKRCDDRPFFLTSGLARRASAAMTRSHARNRRPQRPLVRQGIFTNRRGRRTDSLYQLAQTGRRPRKFRTESPDGSQPIVVTRNARAAAPVGLPLMETVYRRNGLGRHDPTTKRPTNTKSRTVFRSRCSIPTLHDRTTPSMNAGLVQSTTLIPTAMEFKRKRRLP